ncbi:mitogen-activated protein kinase kinase kinase [Malassezia vespertilionis]|uniref:Ssk2p n=1 Tax=Malassezia vespertilionis TaxID=2020962 RepID=A0A2N1J7W0_9BASI|nr:mitogen-activated protein kinase kinase kinase [Malassezia vespertilionis]PKI82645.1 Ssk2p [Malassezia vespertilionis]WFD08572.1 mitogen-activated protein kinase kinase kinase [Malassezia vespertilionis]
MRAARVANDADVPQETPSYFAQRGENDLPVATPAQLTTPQAEHSLLEFDDDPKKRMEWQTMLRSMLESEVLSSETKRIASADRSSPREFMYQLWLNIRAVQYGDAALHDRAEREEREVKALRAMLVPALVQDILAYKADGSTEPDAAERTMGQVSALLERVDTLDALFPARRVLLHEFPDWAAPHLQHKLEALYAWFNTTRSLREQGHLLAQWSGSFKELGSKQRANMGGELVREALFFESVFREANLHETFEPRTLHSLNRLVLKANGTLRAFHTQFEAMQLPSFERDVLPLIQFPMWLAKGALQQRLEYSDKLREPSLLLVESLSDDLRATIALACRMKKQYMCNTVPEQYRGWDLPLESDDAFDATVCSALHFFFRLLHFRLKSNMQSKEIDMLEPEWDFFCSAVSVIPGGDTIVAHKTARMTNRLFARIIAPFQRELQPPQPGTPQRSVQETTRTVHGVFNSERVRSRKLLGFARKVRGRLENAAEYDLRSLRERGAYDLSTFMQTLLKADYFLVYTGSFEEHGVYILAEPSLHNKPYMIHDLLFKCIRQSRGEASTHSPESPTERWRTTHYLLLLSPRDPFLWTGKVMTLPLPYINVSLKDQRLRLVADGPHERLEQCKRNFVWRFAPHGTRAVSGHHSAFPLATVYERMAHLSMIQHELKMMDKGGYVLTDTLVHSVPLIRQRMVAMRHKITALDRASCDELVHTCFGIAVDQGARALTYIESFRLRRQISQALARLAVEWITFICDDCEPTEQRTFKWAVAALENAMTITNGDNIFLLTEKEFHMLKTKVSSCMALLISHFDILGARTNAARLQEEQHDGAAKVQEQEQHTPEEPSTSSASARRFARTQAQEEARHAALAELRLVGRVLDDTRLEDQGLQMLASKGVQIRWQQGRFIGSGTFGTVYLAVNLDSGGLMAVKEIRFQELSSTPNLYKQIHDEMNAMEMLRHPNIVEYYGIEVHRDKVYIFEEYCQGGSLAQLLEHGRFEDEMILQVYALQMLDGLMYLHAKGVVHRDIKPENILLDHMGVIKFVDFGAAKVLSTSSRTLQRSRIPGWNAAPGGVRAGQSLQGTPMYMSPEVIKGEQSGRHGAMDVWSLGCVLLECATGSRPWSQLDNEWAIMFHIGMAKQHPPLPDEGQLSAPGIDFLRECLTIDPHKRPTAVELRNHPWIRALVDVLNAKSEPEPEAGASTSPSEGAISPSKTPGYEALIADKQYRRQDAQIKAMLEPESPYSAS